jgi:integrase
MREPVAMRLSVKQTDALKVPAGKAEAIWFDDRLPGFGLRVRASGARSWVYQYTIGGKTRRVTIGRAGPGAITPDQARAIAIDLHARVRRGEDVVATREVDRATSAQTFGTVVGHYLEFVRDTLRPRSQLEVCRHLERDAKPFHGLPVSAIDRRLIADRLTHIAGANGPVAANRARTAWSAMFTWAIKRGLAENNPVINTPQWPEHSRDRVLSDAELHTIWSALENDDFGAIVKLLMLTGQRKSEIGWLHWSEIQDGMILLPAARVKNKRVHLVPLSAQALAVLASIPQRLTANGQPRDYVFGSRDDAGFNNWGAAKAGLNARIGAIEPWVLHDLRRTVVTKMAEDLGIAPHVIEMVVNHVSGRSKIASIYNRSTLITERKQALVMWGEHLAAIVEGRVSNVTPLRRA